MEEKHRVPSGLGERVHLQPGSHSRLSLARAASHNGPAACQNPRQASEGRLQGPRGLTAAVQGGPAPPPRTREDSGVLGARCGKEEGSGRPGSRRGAWEAGVSRGRGALSARDQERAGKRSGVRPWGPWLCGRQGKAETGSMQRGRTNGHGRPGPLLGGIQPEKQPPSRPLPAPAQGPMQELGVDTPGQPWLSGG